MYKKLSPRENVFVTPLENDPGCMENVDINIQCKFHVFLEIYFRITPRTEINFVENRLGLKIQGFLSGYYLRDTI